MKQSSVFISVTVVSARKLIADEMAYLRGKLTRSTQTYRSDTSSLVMTVVLRLDEPTELVVVWSRSEDVEKSMG